MVRFVAEDENEELADDQEASDHGADQGDDDAEYVDYDEADQGDDDAEYVDYDAAEETDDDLTEMAGCLAHIRATEAMWWGIASLVALVLPWFLAIVGNKQYTPLIGFMIVASWAGGIALGITAIVKAVRIRRDWNSSRATAGLVTGIIGVSLNGLMTAASAIVILASLSASRSSY